jgi:serine/threonine-protein kinase
VLIASAAAPMAISLRVMSLSSSRILSVSRHPDDDVTIGPTIETVPTATPTDGARARMPTPSSRFAPGSIIAGRYRLVALLGRGGMGEVYRADDLTLDQPVALKFLPEQVAADPAHLAQFHNELRVARQVSHKNVCRLYDLGEAEGRRFLTMEYVDGEDLASLLRRIGRIPQDKATELARQLCAGLAAAHERGVLHRDLKPANVMIDGDGNVRITDFGLAVNASDVDAVRAGTPQYMAPEQLRPAPGGGPGPPATIKSDIYALGLVLFEIFTGRRAYEAKTLADLIKAHESGAIATPSSVVRDLDPAVERTILRCLERDPARRPASALAVAVALPGGDPLAAALAAGETPSPDALAAAAETDAIPVRLAIAIFAFFIACAAIYVVLSPRMTIADLVPLEKPPAVLADRAQQIIAEFGYADAPADTAQNFRLGVDYPRWIVETDQSLDRWTPARVAKGPALLFWYRTSPRDLEPESPSPTVSPTDPAMTVTGMTLAILDTRGRLVEFRRVPPQRDEAPASPTAVQWDAVFRAAGLSQASFTPVPPTWNPKDFADVRAAWEGPAADAPDIHIRIEGAAYRGRIMSFYTVGPWSRPRAMQPMTQSTTSHVLSIFAGLLWITVLAGALLLARYNVRANRADRRSAARLAGVFLVLQAAAWMVGAHHLASLAEINSFFRVFGNVLLEAVLLWSLYLALEPFGRRFWPDGLLGWTRLFSGHVRDPRIGREILIGAALGGALMLVDLARGFALNLIGLPAGLPGAGADVRVLGDLSSLALSWVDQFYGSVQTAFVVVMVFVGLRLIVRRTWIAVVVGVLLVTAAVMQNVPTGGVLWLHGIIQLATIGIITFAIFRFGLLVTTVMIIVDNIPTAVPIVPHGPSWAALPGNLSIALVVAVACFGFYAARAGQPLFGKYEV